MVKLCKFGHLIGSDLDCVACKRSCIAKKRWQNPSDSMIKACAEARKLTHTNGLKSEAAQAKRDKYFSSDLHRQRAKQQAIKLAEERRLGLRQPCSIINRDTKPELIVRSTLDVLRIHYIQQFVVGPYAFDFCLPNNKILIEVQGEYWHSLPNVIANDLAKESYINSQHPEYQIIYISELDTKKVNGVLSIIKRYIDGDISQRIINLHEIIIQPTNADAAAGMLTKYHYLPQFRKKVKDIHGLYYQGELIGVILYSSPSYNTVINRHNLAPRQVLELSRLVVADDCHVKNLISKFISKSSKLLKQTNQQVCLLVSYADPHFGHTGYVYRASNWIYDGDTPPSYYYIDEYSNIIHKKTVWDHAQKLRQTEINYAITNKLTKINSEPKKRYLYWLRQSTYKPKNIQTSVEANCLVCKNQFIITKCASKAAVAKHGGYLCLSCSIKNSWKNGIYKNRPKRSKVNLFELVTVVCFCGSTKNIQRKSANQSIKKYGRYTCMSCIKRNLVSVI